MHRDGSYTEAGNVAVSRQKCLEALLEPSRWEEVLKADSQSGRDDKCIVQKMSETESEYLGTFVKTNAEHNLRIF